MNPTADDFVTVARVGEISEGQGRCYELNGRPVAVFLHEGAYYALDDRCPHMGESLSLGTVCEGQVMCNRHRWEFALADGRCPHVPTLWASVFPVRLVGDEIQVQLPPA